MDCASCQKRKEKNYPGAVFSLMRKFQWTVPITLLEEEDCKSARKKWKRRGVPSLPILSYCLQAIGAVHYQAAPSHRQYPPLHVDPPVASGRMLCGLSQKLRSRAVSALVKCEFGKHSFSLWYFLHMS